MGTVSVENDALSGITVKISGMAESETLTGTTGQYSFTGLRAGKYTVEISGFDDEDVGFNATSATADLDVGSSQVVTFEGTYLRASSIMGQVSIEGTGLADVTVSLQGKGETREMTTNGAGQYLFEDLRRGDYAIGISGFDDDEYGFDVTSKSIHVPYGETENIPFEGIALRTAEIRGVIAVDGMGPLEGVTVSLTGKGDADPVTTMGDGRFSFDRLHAGDYTISIFGYDTDEYGFDVTSQNVTVALKETATLEFDGIMLRTAAIEGMVTVKGDGLKDVTVTVAGGPKDEEHEAMTNSAGMYDVGDLHAGDYAVTISGYDTKEYGFEVTTKSVSVGLRETAEVAFDGILLRTAGVSGRVTIDGEPMSGLTVTLEGEEDRSGMTNSDGQYAFSGLAAGDYMLTLSGYDAYEYEFDPSTMDIELELDEAAIANFEGRSLRTVVVMGTVSAEGDPLMNVGVTLIKVIGTNTGEVLGAMMTDEDGEYMFDELLAGIYRIELGETGDEYAFATKSQMGSVATDETAMWNFDAEIIRTASVGGMVTVDGEGMADVMVMLAGDHDTEMEMETDSDGMYMFDGLRKGGYTVSIMNPDEDMYDFPTTERMVSLAVGQEQEDISFAGSMNRRASISGQVHVEGGGIEGVTVKLRGEERADTETDGNGEYNFPGLAGGDYTVSIENPDEDAYTFAVTSVDVDHLGDETAEIVDFAGEHTTTASVRGMLFVDEVKVDSMYTEGEPMLEFMGFPLLLQGPGVNDSRIGATDTTGAYSFDSLKAGTYNVVINMTTQLRAALSRAGYAFSGNELNIGIEVPAATDVDLNLPFRITKQTIHAGAQLATNARSGMQVGGVSMALYPTAEDAQDGTNSLGTATTRSSGDHMGIATFEFDRSRDKGPGGTPIDYLVYAKVTRVGNSDLHVHSNEVIEIAYERADRESRAPAVVKLINTRVNFQWWVKSNATAKDGNQFLGGWRATNGSATNSRGLATYTGRLSASQIAAAIRGLPARFTVAMSATQADSVDMNEKWTASGSKSHSHTGLENPATNTMAANDLGAIYITWETHSLVLGVYRETDDEEGYTNYQSRVPGGDHRPVSSVARGMKITALAKDDRGRDKPYKYDHDACWNRNSRNTDPIEPVFTIRNGLARVTCLPRNDEFTIKFEVDTMSAPSRVEVGIVAEELHGYLEPFNEDDLTVNPDGSTVGTFGDGSGGVPEVRLCLSSEKTSDEECATWGYQWMTGSIIGNVGTQSGHKLHIEPDTENHGADTASSFSGTGGAYEFEGLRDGVYEITAYSTRTYRVNGDATKTDMVVYHDETTGTAAQDTARWTTTRLGLRIMGYVGNDANRDNRLRGEETAAGISVSVSGSGVSKSTTTDERGFYRFDDLPDAGKAYTITVRSNSITYDAARSYNRFTGRATTTHTKAEAQDYPSSAKPTEGDVRLPYVSNPTSRSITNTTTDYCNTATPPKCGKLYNFGLIYKDGEIEGRVTNISGSSSGIDLLWIDGFTSDTTDFEVRSSLGTFATGRLYEGDYALMIEDAGWSIPRLNSRGEPDDDGFRSAPSVVRASVRGKDDSETMPTLWVYDASASQSDNVTRATASTKIHGTTAENFDSAVTWSGFWTRSFGTETTTNPTSLGTISWKQENVTFSIGRAFRSTSEFKSGSTTCTSTRCTMSLGYNRTGSLNEGEAMETTMTLTVTAQNRYDDHEYSVIVARAAPVGNELVRGHFLRVDLVDGKEEDTTHAIGDGDGKTVARAWTLETKDATGSSMDMRIDLDAQMLGDVEEGNAYCPQSVAMVKEYNDDDDDALESLNPPDEDDYEDDVCRDTRYRLSVNTLYEIEIESEDGVSETYYVNTRNRDRGADAELESLEVDGDEVELVSGDTTYSFMNADEQITVEWVTADENASVLATPRDADSNEEGHQFDLGDPDETDTLTIRVTSENGDTTIIYVLDIRRLNNVATLASLSAGAVTLNPEFDSETTSYTADVAHEVGTATFAYTQTDPDGSTSQTPANPVALTAGGTTTVSIVSTAEDGSTSMTYTVAVARADAPPDAVPAILFVQDENVVESVTVGEGDSLIYGVRLEKEPATDVVVTLPTYPTTVFTRATGVTATFTFTSTDYADAQYDTLVSVEDDDGADGEVNGLFVTDDGASDDEYDDVEGTLAITITDDDERGITMDPLGIEFVEGADALNTYRLRLATRPTRTVTISPDADDLPEGVTVTPEEWVVSPTGTGWMDGQPFTIASTDDTDEDNTDLSVSVSHSVASNGDYDGETVGDMNAVIHATEEPSVIISVTRKVMDEGTNFEYSISLSTEPDANETVTVTIDCKTSDFTAGCGGTELEFTTATAQTHTLTAAGVNPDRDVVVSHTVSTEDEDEGEDGNYADVTTASSIQVRIVDVDEN